MSDSMWDFRTQMVRNLADLDRKMATVKRYYTGLDDKERDNFVTLIRKVSEPFPLEFDAFMSLMQRVGWNENRSASFDVEICVEQETVRVPPQILRVAVDAWEKGEEFTPPMTFDFA